jgi:hypothetical protein
MWIRRAAVLTALAVLSATLAVPALGESDPVYVGIYSDQWNSELDIRNLGVVGERQVTFGGTFHRPDEGFANTFHILESVWRAEATPVANLEIFASSARIAAGDLDASITEWAGSVQAWLAQGDGRSLLIAPMAEMNGSWVPWGMDPTTFPDAFRRVVTIFRDLGMDETQVRWIWAPNSISSWPVAMTSFWPGSDYVDLVGFSAYNLGGEPDNWVSVTDSLHLASQVLRTVARDKPFLITQIGSGPDGGEQDQWIMDMVDFIREDPNMVGFVYFNFDKEADWRVWDGFEVSEGWARAMQQPQVAHEWPLSGWFQPGPISFDQSPVRASLANSIRPATQVERDPVDAAFTGIVVLREHLYSAVASRVRPD